MMIDASESEIFERPRSQRFDETLTRRHDVDVAARDLLEQILELFV